MTNAIITVATMKGGSGKSTVASCLAVHWHLMGRNPIIVDADPQRSISRLAARERALGGVAVLGVTTDEGAPDLARAHGPVIIDTPGFRSPVTLSLMQFTDLVLVPVKPSPFDIDRMLDTFDSLLTDNTGRKPAFRCILTQTTQRSVVARHIRAELADAGYPLLESEMPSRVTYPEAALYGATPTLIDPRGAAARDIAAIAEEIDQILGADRQAAVA